MSGLWTPSGEHSPADESDRAPAEPVDEAALAEEIRRVRAELAATPVADIIANHAVGLWQLAILHLTPEEGAHPRLDEASLGIDAMAGLVESLGDRLGPHAQALRDALAQLRMAYVEVQERAAQSDTGTEAEEPS